MQFFRGTGREPGSQNYAIPGGNWQLAARSLVE